MTSWRAAALALLLSGSGAHAFDFNGEKALVAIAAIAIAAIQWLQYRVLGEQHVER